MKLNHDEMREIWAGTKVRFGAATARRCFGVLINPLVQGLTSAGKLEVMYIHKEFMLNWFDEMEDEFGD